jgi:hypothetical protein
MFEPLAAIPATLEAIVRGWPTCLFQRLTVWSRVFGGPAAVLATSRASLFAISEAEAPVVLVTRSRPRRSVEGLGDDEWRLELA